MVLKTPNRARTDGSTLSSEDIQQLRSEIKGSVLMKADADKADYDKAMKRWNEVYIKQAVWVLSLLLFESLFVRSILIYVGFQPEYCSLCGR